MAISAQIPLILEPGRTDQFENFVDGPNRAAVAAVKDILEQSGTSIFLYGPPSSGKTHLLNALCSLAHRRDLAAFYVAASRVSPDASAGLRDLQSFDLVCLDDIDRVARNRAWEEAAFHCFNQVREDGGNMVISSRLPLSELALSLRDLQSRLGWDLQVGLQILTDDLKLKVLNGRSKAAGTAVPEEVIQYLVKRGRRDLGSLTRALDLLSEAAYAGKRKITIPLAREVLASQARPGEQYAEEA